jgi:hypothetical protein
LNLSKLAQIAAAGFLTLAPSFAAQINFFSNASNPDGLGAPTSHSETIGGANNTRVFGIPPITPSFTVTATAWGKTGNVYGIDTTLEQANLGRYSNGLGVCNDEEVPCVVGIGTIIDNLFEDDYVLLEFSAAINITSITVYSSGFDRDISFWTRNNGSAPTLSGRKPSTSAVAGDDIIDEGFVYGGHINNSNTPDPLTIALNQGSALSTELLIGGKLGDINDRFLLAALNFKYSDDPTIPGNTAVPEPTTYVTLGTSLLGLAIYSHRRRR